MSEKQLWSLINPSDTITFRATLTEAAFIAARMAPNFLFVEHAHTGAKPEIENLKDAYDALWRDAGQIASYAEAFSSFLVGRPDLREEFERRIADLPIEEQRAERAAHNDRHRTSMNDICAACWATGERIAATAPDEPALPAAG